MQRKSFILVSIVGLTAMAMPQLDYVSGNREIKNYLTPPSFLSRICDAKTIQGIGNAYNKQFPAQAHEDSLMALLLPEQSLYEISRPAGKTGISSYLEKKMQKDFKMGDTVVMNGWILSVTEARQAALFSILPT